MALTQINKAGLDEIALDHVFTIGASGSSAYTFQGEGLNGTVNNPTLYLTRGKTYRFENTTGGHPIRIQSTSGASGTQYNTGVTNNASAGTVIVEVQHDAPDVLYYQCTSHAAMNGILYVTGALADGSVTTAKIATSAVTTNRIASQAVNQNKLAPDSVSTAKIEDGAVTNAKIANSAVTGAKLSTNSVGNGMIVAAAVSTDKIANVAVTTAKIADNAVTHAKYQDIPTSRILGRTSSGTGDVETLDDSTVRSFLGVSAGANQTTINSNGDNRVLTGTGTANTIQGESQLLFDSNGLLYIKAPDGGNRYFFGETGNSQSAQLSLYNSSDQQKVRIAAGDGSNSAVSFFTGGGLGIGKNSNSETTNGAFFSDTVNNIVLPSTNYIVVNRNASGAATLVDFRSQNQSKGGIHFNGTNIAYQSGSNNIFNQEGLTFDNGTHYLDDYEEGTYVPVVRPNKNASPFTYNTHYELRSPHASGATNTIAYTKIGNRVYLSFSLYFNTNGTDRVNISLPFAIKNDDYSCAGHCGYFSVASTYGVTFIGNGLTTIDLMENDSNGGHPNLSYATNTEIYINFHYQTN